MQPMTIARRRKVHVVNVLALLTECEQPGTVVLPGDHFTHLSPGWLGACWEEAKDLSTAAIAAQIARELQALRITAEVVHWGDRIMIGLTSEARLDLARAVAMRWCFWHCHGVGMSAGPNVSIGFRSRRTGADLGNLPTYL